MPTLNLTAKKLDALKPIGDRQTDFFDAWLPGFAIRLSPSGRKTFTLLYRYAGKLRRLTIGTYPPLTLADARDRATDALREANKGIIDPVMQKRQARMGESFSDLAQQYLERYAKHKKRSWREDERRINNLLIPEWGTARAKDIARADVRAFLEKLAENAPIEANRVHALLRKIYNWLLEQDLVETTPCLRLPRPATERQRDRVLSEDEIKILWKALEEEGSLIAATFKLRLTTAQRGGEVLAMKWPDVDFSTGWWTIPGESTKNSLPHRVPLSAQSVRILKKIKETAAHSDWVFPSPRGQGRIENVQKAMVRFRTASGVDFRAHDLRRTAASHMASMGISRLTIQKILNHVERGVTAVYDRHSYDAEKRQALEIWGKKIDVILAGKKEKRKGVDG